MPIATRKFIDYMSSHIEAWLRAVSQMGLPADMGWCAEGPSAYPQRKAMFEKWKARMESEIENVNRAGRAEA